MTELRVDLKLIAQWIKPHSRILDLGCGDGSLLLHLKQHSNVSGYGLEIDTQNITTCVQRGLNVIQTDLDAGLSEFDNNSFDYVIMTHTLQAVQHPDKLLQEMLRIGKEGIVTFPNFGHWLCRWQLALGRMPVTPTLKNQWYDTPNIHLCTLKNFEDLCRNQSLNILQRAVVDQQHSTSLAMNLLPNLLGQSALYRIQRI